MIICIPISGRDIEGNQVVCHTKKVCTANRKTQIRLLFGIHTIKNEWNSAPRREPAISKFSKQKSRPKAAFVKIEAKII
jgi:hypothetical protein